MDGNDGWQTTADCCWRCRENWSEGFEASANFNATGLNIEFRRLVWREGSNGQKQTEELGSIDRNSAPDRLLQWLEKRAEFANVQGVAHRVVHGMARTTTQVGATTNGY